MTARPAAGETFVWGHDKHVARALLASARKLDGYDVHDVSTTINGFIVPEAVADDAATAIAADPPDDNPENQF